MIEAECLPPVAQGDGYRAAIRHPCAIGIIDGYFARVPSVWHKEILWAMSQGIHVFGSASMGALRAAELEPFGMVGVREVFEAYRDGVLEDDEVAVAHRPSGESFRCCSDAMVNICAKLAKALADGVIQAATSRASLRIAKGLFYHHRSWACIFEMASSEQVSSLEIEALRAWIPCGNVNRKRRDARAILRTMREFLASDPGPKRVFFVFEETLYGDEMMRESGEVRLE